MQLRVVQWLRLLRKRTLSTWHASLCEKRNDWRYLLSFLGTDRVGHERTGEGVETKVKVKGPTLDCFLFWLTRLVSVNGISVSGWME